MASWVVFNNGNYIVSNQMPVYAGDVLDGRITWQANNPNCPNGNAGYDILSLDVAAGRQESLTYCSAILGQEADPAVLEAYWVGSCSDLPYTYTETYYSIVSTPAETAWTGTVWPSLTPTCSYGTYATSTANTLLWYPGAGGGGGGGGGSLAPGTLITMFDQSRKPVEKVVAGDKLVGYDTSNGKYALSRVSSVKTVTTNNLLIIGTETGMTLVVDKTPTEILWTELGNGTRAWLPVTTLSIGDSLFTQNGWVTVTSFDFISNGTYILYDITASMPYFANGYLDPPQPS